MAKAANEKQIWRRSCGTKTEEETEGKEEEEEEEEQEEEDRRAQMR